MKQPLREKGSPRNALLEYNQAVELRPDIDEMVQQRRAVMVQLGMGEEVRHEWEKLLKTAAANHPTWHGFAELCLYLGHQNEYERACHELLDRFGTRQDPMVCERTGKACLLGKLGPEDTQRASAIIDRALATGSSAPGWLRPYMEVAHGLAQYRLGDFDGAIKSIRGQALQVLGPFPYLVRSMAARQAGRADDAFLNFAAGLRMYDWNPARVDNPDAWRNHALRREAEQVIMPNLAALLAEQDKAHSQGERLALIAVCQSLNRTSMAARLYAEAFAGEPSLASRAYYRYEAACCAARCGCGDGDDAQNLKEDERALWRKQACRWLHDDLVAHKALLSHASGGKRAAVLDTMASWFKEPALARLHDENSLRKLPASEQQTWRILWRDAKAALDAGTNLGRLKAR